MGAWAVGHPPGAPALRSLALSPATGRRADGSGSGVPRGQAGRPPRHRPLGRICLAWPTIITSHEAAGACSWMTRMAAPTSLRWLARLPECGGKVGTLGTGYVGGTRHDPARDQPPQVACM